MKRVRVIAILLTAVLSVSSLPVASVSAAQTATVTAYATQKVQSNSPVTIKETTSTKKSESKKKVVKLGWVKKNNKWYYVTKKGNKTGWAKIDGKKYYFDSKGVMLTGVQTIKGKKYCFSRSGHILTGWKKLSKKWFYFDKKDGHMWTGWKHLGDRWFLLDRKTGAMATGWTTDKGKKYYFRNDGVLLNGPHVYKIGKKYYFFESGGALTTTEGWKVSDSGAHFYTYKDGTIAVNKEIDGKIIAADGVGVIKTKNEMDRIAQGYASDTKYLVLANLDTHQLCVYKGNRGEWKRIKGEWELTCGAPATRTPCGQFKLCYKHPTGYGWKNFKLCRAAYVYWTTAGFMIHTILYEKWGSDDPEYAEIADDRLGMNLSMSCIRLALEHARWIYKNIPTGTRLVVVE